MAKDKEKEKKVQAVGGRGKKRAPPPKQQAAVPVK